MTCGYQRHQNKHTRGSSSGLRTPLSTIDDVYIVFLEGSAEENDWMSFILLTINIGAASKREDAQTNLDSGGPRMCVTCLWLARGKSRKGEDDVSERI
jgi:hypothetical protein